MLLCMNSPPRRAVGKPLASFTSSFLVNLGNPLPPDLTPPLQGPELEVYSMGVTLYILLFGEHPFFTVEEAVEGVRWPGRGSLAARVEETTTDTLFWLNFYISLSPSRRWIFPQQRQLSVLIFSVVCWKHDRGIACPLPRLKAILGQLWLVGLVGLT